MADTKFPFFTQRRLQTTWKLHLQHKLSQVWMYKEIGKQAHVSTRYDLS